MRKTVTLLLLLAILLSMSLNASADTFGYSDPDSGMSLQVPKGWKIAAEDDHIRFEADNSKVTMTYRCEDVWDGLSRADKAEISRKEYNNDLLSKADVADLVDARSKDVSAVDLNGVEYFSVTTSVTKGFLFFKSTAYTTSLIHFQNGWMHLFQFRENTDHKDYPRFEELVCSASYAEEADIVPETTQPTIPETTAPVITDQDIYWDAQEAYERGDLLEAQQLFECVPAYEDAQDYLRLIRIRDYGSNSGIGTVYAENKGLAQFMKDDIDKAAQRFYFADTAEVLLCNTDVACYYLYGSWITGAGAPAYAYFKLHKDYSGGGYYYTRSSNLSNAVSSTVSIIDGDVRISITSSNTLVFHIDLTAPDCMDIYSYETCKDFTLYRN